MRKKLKNNLIAAVAVVLVLAIAVTAAYALLLHETKVDSSVVFGEIMPDSTDFVLSQDLNLKFDAPGSAKKLYMNVKSYAEIPLEYFYSFELNTTNSNGLEKALFVYINGDYIGALSSLVADADNLPYSNYILPQTETRVDEVNDEITFELHNGAESSWVDGKTCAIKVKMLAQTIDYSDNIFVSNEKELRLAIDDVNNSDNQIKSVHIGNDIRLTADISIANGCIIDFLGGKIFTGVHNINIVPNRSGITKTIKFISMRNSYADSINDRDAIVLNASDMAIELGENTADLGKLVTVLHCDSIKANEIVAKNVSDKLYNGISVGETVNVLDGYDFYIRDGILEVKNMIDGNYSYANGLITIGAVDKYVLSSIKIGNTDVNFTIYPKYSQNAPNIELIINNELRHIVELSKEGNVYELTYDLFLPTFIPQYGMSISWLSDSPSILNAEGICGSDAEGEVTLTATIRYNREVLIKSYTISVYKQSNQMRFDYLVARIGEKKLSALYDDVYEPVGSYFTLPIVSASNNNDDYRSMFDMNNIGLKSLTYQVNPNNIFLDMLNGNKIIMREATFENYAEVTIRGVFKNEPNKIYEDTIPIEIKLVDNENLHAVIVEYLQNLLDGTDVLQNILNTRAAEGMQNERGDFTLPGHYKGYDIKFSLTDGTETYQPDEIISGITVGDSGNGHSNYTFNINAEKFKNTIHTVEFFVKIKISIEDENSLPESIAALYVSVPPAIHYANDDVTNESLFYTLKLQNIEQLNGEKGVPTVGGVVNEQLRAVLKLNYILLYDLKRMTRLDLVGGENIYSAESINQKLSGNDEFYYYEITADSIIGSYDALALIDLSEINVLNKPDYEIFDNAFNGASQFVDFIAKYYKNITNISINNCVINNTHLFIQMSMLNHIDLRGSTLNGFNWINVMKNNDLQYLDLSNTNFNTSSHLDVLSAAYYSYVLRHTDLLPNYYYTKDGLRIKFVPMQNENELKLIFYLYCLSDITDLKWNFLQLTNNIYGIENEAVAINWSVALGDENKAQVGIKTKNGINSIVLQNLLIGTMPPVDKTYETITLIAELTQNGITVKRNFVVNIYY